MAILMRKITYKMISTIVYITIHTFYLLLVDCWDGGDSYGEEPIIYHGWTMTSKILFKDVIQDAIKKYAFFKSDYPLILSIENHCSIEYQDKMASHMEEILGDMLYNEKVDESLEALPSPEDLKGKVLQYFLQNMLIERIIRYFLLSICL